MINTVSISFGSRKVMDTVSISFGSRRVMDAVGIVLGSSRVKEILSGPSPVPEGLAMDWYRNAATRI